MPTPYDKAAREHAMSEQKTGLPKVILESNPSTWPKHWEGRSFSDYCKTALMEGIERHIMRDVAVLSEENGVQNCERKSTFSIFRRFEYAPEEIQAFHVPAGFHVKSVLEVYGYKEGHGRYTDAWCKGILVTFEEDKNRNVVFDSLCSDRLYITLLHKGEHGRLLTDHWKRIEPHVLNASVSIRGEDYIVLSGIPLGKIGYFEEKSDPQQEVATEIVSPITPEELDAHLLKSENVISGIVGRINEALKKRTMVDGRRDIALEDHEVPFAELLKERYAKAGWSANVLELGEFGNTTHWLSLSRR